MCEIMKSRRLKKHLFSLLLIFLTVFLSCNKYTYRTIYNQLDFILYLEVKKYFNPDKTQKEFIKQRLASLLNWNRVNVLPRIRDLMFYMREPLHKGLSGKDIIYLYEKLNNELIFIAEKAAPDAAVFILSLNPGQLDNYREETARHRMEEEREEQSNGKSPAERRTISTVKFLSNIYGSFSDEQIAKIREYVEGTTIPDYDRWEFQSIKQNELIELTGRKVSKEQMAIFLKNWITRNSASTPAPYRERFEARRKFNMNLYLYVDNNIVTFKQREHAVETLDKWISTINKLISEN